MKSAIGAALPLGLVDDTASLGHTVVHLFVLHGALEKAFARLARQKAIMVTAHFVSAHRTQVFQGVFGVGLVGLADEAARIAAPRRILGHGARVGGARGRTCGREEAVRTAVVGHQPRHTQHSVVIVEAVTSAVAAGTGLVAGGDGRGRRRDDSGGDVAARPRPRQITGEVATVIGAQSQGVHRAEVLEAEAAEAPSAAAVCRVGAGDGGEFHHPASGGPRPLFNFFTL